MVNYRRNKLKTGHYFFTLTLADRKSKLLTTYIKELKYAFNRTNNLKPYKTKAIVILPDHLHIIWELPDDDYAGRIRCLKGLFTTALLKQGVKLHKNSRGEYNLWQKRYWEHTLRDDSDFEAHVNYIHYNPVKHGLVKEVREWQYSSFHRFVRFGVLSEDWGGLGVDVIVEKFGE